MRVSRYLCAVALLVALAVPYMSYAEGIPDEQYSINSLAASQGSSTQNKYGVYFDENVDTLRMPTLLAKSSWNSSKNMPETTGFCTGLKDPNCIESEQFRFYALYPPCKSDSEVDCIEEVYALRAGVPTRIRGEFTSLFPANVSNPYQADPSRGLPQGSNASIWRIPGVLHGGSTEEYAVLISRVGSIQRKGDEYTIEPSIQTYLADGDFRAAIYPVTIVKDEKYRENKAIIGVNGRGVSALGVSHPSQRDFTVCAVVADGACALRQSFPTNVRFGVTIRFSKKITGWLHGRIDSPIIDYQLKSNGTRISMEGLATKVPIVAGWVDAAKISAEDLKILGLNGIPPGQSSYPGANGDEAMRAIQIWSKLLKDTSQAMPTQWIFYNLPTWRLREANSCITNNQSLSGFVTTNSTTYMAAPPTFNVSTGTLDYKVASLHFMPNGEKFLGNYNLYIDSKVARCIYGFSNAPISATISIVNSEGTSTIATTTVREESGWIHLQAEGFTFSSPTIKVKLVQGAISTLVTTGHGSKVVSTPAQKAAKKITITCVQIRAPHSSRKIVGIAPKCPAGFRKR